MTDIDTTIRDVVIANRIMAREGIIDGFGHVSLRHPTDPNRYFLSRSRSPELVTRDDIIEFTLDGDPVTPTERAPYLERVIHGEIFRARADVGAVVHHHAPTVLAFTILDLPLRPAYHMAALMGAHCPVWDSQDEFGDTSMLVDDVPKGRSLAKALGDGYSALLRGHGAVCVAANVRELMMTAVYMRDNAELILKALPLGTVAYLTEGEIAQTRKVLTAATSQRRAWDYFVARAGFQGI